MDNWGFRIPTATLRHRAFDLTLLPGSREGSGHLTTPDDSDSDSSDDGNEAAVIRSLIASSQAKEGTDSGPSGISHSPPTAQPTTARTSTRARQPSLRFLKGFECREIVFSEREEEDSD